MSELQASPADSTKDAAVVIGNFDGVHRGHQALVAYTLELAKQNGLRPMAMTFDPHPATVLGGVAPAALTTTERKVELLKSIAPELDVMVQRFDSEFAQLTPEQFVERVLVGHIHVRQLVVGANFRFGRNRAGTVAVLGELGQKFDFTAHGVELTSDSDGDISSSRIRRLIADGEVARAEQLLGRPHSLSGTVVAGDGLGRTIGVPTANLAGVPEILPKVGIYSGSAQLVDGPTTRDLGLAVMHVGPRPTVDLGETVEVHLIDQRLDLYGRTLRVAFRHRLRDIVRFADLDSLKHQISLDIEAARNREPA